MASKRALDVTVSVLLLAVFAPVIAVVVVAMAVDGLVVPRDRGPLLYRERRISRGEPFDLLKFRTLRVDVLERMRHAGGYARTHEADPANLTWAARRFVKRWYFDELPQLVNVLRGEMSLVGPRAWPVSMVEDQYAQGVYYRRSAVAGLTGPAQVQKGIPDPSNAAKLDLEYLARCRNRGSVGVVAMDLAILWRTVAVLRRGQGLDF